MERKSWKLWILVILAVVVVCVTAGFAGAETNGEWAESAPMKETEHTETYSLDVDTEEAAAVFVDRIMKGTRLRGTILTGTNLTGGSKALYDRLRAGILAIANGTEGCDGSTVFTYDMDDIYTKTSFTKDELGVPIIVNEQFNNAAIEAANTLLKQDLDFQSVTDCIKKDCTYELYWYDKTNGCNYSGPRSYGADGWNGEEWTELTLSGTITVQFCVSQDYAAETESGELNLRQVDIEKYGGAVATAAQNAWNIMSAHENENNYQRLLSYKNEICGLTDYNYAAANKNNNTPYGNPWQLIWVFDGNPNTTVVCEGYSKAFKHLNDISANTDVDVILAEGVMEGGTGAGPHMWNIVRMEDGANYMADITNCDDPADGTRSVGYPDKLFLKAPASGDVTSGYTFSCGNSNVTYTYNGSNYGTDRITLAPYDYLNRPTYSELENGNSEWTMYLGVPNTMGPGSGTRADNTMIQVRIPMDEWDASVAAPAWSVTKNSTSTSGANYDFTYETENGSGGRGIWLVPVADMSTQTSEGDNTYTIGCTYNGKTYRTMVTVHFVNSAPYPTGATMTVAPYDWDTKMIGAAVTVTGGEIQFVKGQAYVLTMNFADNAPTSNITPYMNWYGTNANEEIEQAVYAPSRFDSQFAGPNGQSVFQNNQCVFRATGTGTFGFSASLSIGMSNLTTVEEYTLTITDSTESNWTADYEQNEQTLIISGTGVVTLGENETAPWLAEYNDPDIRRIVISEGITGIGANVFGGLSGRVRVDFLQSSYPQVDANAFGNTDVVCRYYTAGDSWPDSYIYMPHFYQNGALTYGPVSYKEDNHTGWSVVIIEDNNREATLTPEAAREVLIDSRSVALFGLPTEGNTTETAAFNTVMRNIEAEYWNLRLEPGCSGILELKNSTCNLLPYEIIMSANGLTLEVNDSRTDGLDRLWMCEGQATYYGNIQNLKLEGTRYDSIGAVTVYGQIGDLDYCGNEAEGPYAGPYIGTLQVQGGITRGTVYGDTVIQRGNDSSKQITIANGPAKTFGGLTFSELTTVINTAETPDLKVNSQATTVDISDFTLRYNLTAYGNELRLFPKDGSGAGSSDIAMDLPEFTLADIFWGEDTTVNISNPTIGEIVLSGEADGNGGTRGLGTLEIHGSGDVTLNCETGNILIQADPGNRGNIDLRINAEVRSTYIQPNNCMVAVTVYEKGRLQSGNFQLPLRDARSFGTVNGSSKGTVVVSDNALRVMSRSESGNIWAILPSDNEVATAWGSGNGKAMIDLQDETVNDVTEAEINILATEMGINASALQGKIAQVFDLSVTSYTEANGQYTAGNNISRLTNAVPVTISNEAGANAIVARLHQDGPTITAYVMDTATITEDTIGFATNEFSKYLVLTAETGPAFAEPDISVEICDDEYDSVLISLPWVDGASTHDISIYKPDRTMVYVSTWGQGDMQADKCMFQVNIVQGGQNRLMIPGEYYAEITLKGDGHRTTRFRRNFIVAGTGYSFNGFVIPSGTTSIEAEAFAGIPATMVKIPDACTSIGSKAFDGSGLKAVYIPSESITIANDALPAGTLVYTPKGSGAAGWAATNGYEVIFTSKEPK